MRRIATWLLSTVTVLTLLFGYHTSTAGPGATTPETAVVSSHQSTSPARGADSTSGTGQPASETYTGTTVQTRWGPVQVQITVSSGKITQASVLKYPTGNSRDEQINGYALPILVQGTVDAQSANIDMVSGATVTSNGYQRSLQSALDQAGL